MIMKTTQRTPVVRTPDSVYAKADSLSFKLLDAPGVKISGLKPIGTLLMDRWTHHNFMVACRTWGDFPQDGLWRRMQVDVQYYLPPFPMSIGLEEVSIEVTCRDDDPFLMSIRYVKTNGRVCYLDDPDTDEVFK